MDPQRRENIQKQFGARVREIRLSKDMSQESLGHEADLDRTYIGGVEREERNISLINIVKIANALQVSPKDLV